MKSKYTILIICVFYTLCASSFYCQSGKAWFNGKGNRGPALDINTLYSDYNMPHLLPTTSLKYSTHDWIAECALDLLFSAYSQHKFIQMLYLNINNLLMYFLLGTEAPDTIKLSSWRDIRTSMRIITKGEIPYYKNHQVWIVASNLQLHNDKDWLAEGAEKMKEKAEQMLSEGDCQAAAYFLGAMCHFIGDAVFFPHIRDTTYTLNPSQGFEKDLKWRMHYLTSRKLQDWNFFNGVPSFLPENGPFFNHDDAKSEFISHKPKYKDAWLVTWYAAHHVYTGRAATPLHSSNEPYPYRPDLIVEDVHFLCSDETMPEGLDDLETLKTDGIRYGFWDNDFQVQADKRYLETLQHHLNMGVYYTAGVINYVKDGYTKCEAGMEEELTQTIQRLATEYAFLWMMAALGNIALIIVMAQTAVSSALSGKLKILEALGIPFTK